MSIIAAKKTPQPRQYQPADRPLDIKLRHGEAMWVLTQLGFRGPASESTFYEYIKSLRKLGTPFKRGELGLSRRGQANYSYYHLMELVLVLTLRVYNAVPDSVLLEIIRHRDALYRCYRRAYTQRRTGIGAPVSVVTPRSDPIKISGAFLDLQMNFSGGQLARFGPPKLLSPIGALNNFAKCDVASRPFLPINLSSLAENLITAATREPLTRDLTGT